MKILMLGWELPPYNSGGLGVACYQMCQELAYQGVDIEFILPHDYKQPLEFMRVHSIAPGCPSPKPPYAGTYKSYQYQPQKTWPAAELDPIYAQEDVYQKKVARLITSLEFDVIHAHDWLTFRAGLRAQQQTNKPLILHVHSIESDRAGGQAGNPFVAEIEETAMLLADRVVAVSNHTKAAIMRDYAIPSRKIEVVHNSIDVANQLPLSTDNAYQYLEIMKQQGYQVVTSVSRLTIQKGLSNFLLTAQKVLQHRPKTFFLIVGSGEQYFELIEQAASLGLGEQVIFTGFQRGKRWSDAFAVSDLFVMPSVSEPFGLTPLEAAGYGLPSLISRQSGVAEVLHNCLKADFWDIDRMASYIIAVLDQPALRQELKRNVTQEYKRLTWQQSAQKLIDIYHTPKHGIPA